MSKKSRVGKPATIKTYMHTKWFAYLYPTSVVHSKVLIWCEASKLDFQISLCYP